MTFFFLLFRICLFPLRYFYRSYNFCYFIQFSCAPAIEESKELLYKSMAFFLFLSFVSGSNVGVAGNLVFKKKEKKKHKESWYSIFNFSKVYKCTKTDQYQILVH